MARPNELQADRDGVHLFGYMLNELKPEEMETIRRRLNEDPAFHRFASAIIYSMYDSSRKEVTSRDHQETKEHWTAFERLVISTHQLRKKRRRRMLLMVILSILAGFSSIVMLLV